jgi:hypothetical protein
MGRYMQWLDFDLFAIAGSCSASEHLPFEAQYLK